MRLLKTNFISFAVILAHTPDMFTLMDHVICKLWNYSMCSTYSLYIYMFTLDAGIFFLQFLQVFGALGHSSP